MSLDSSGTKHHDDYVRLFDAEFAATARSVRHVVGDAADDVAQEAFVVALRQWKTVATLEAPGAWVRLVARRIAWRMRLREQRRPQLEMAVDVGASPFNDATSDLDLSHAMARLAPRERLAVTMHHLQGLPIRQVAEALGASEAATKVLLFRSRERLGADLSGHHGTWVSSHRWWTDDVVSALRGVASPADIDIVVNELDPRGARWMLSLERGRYRLMTDDGERLDWGTFRSRGGALEMKPWDQSGLVRLGTRVDGDGATFALLSDTTHATRGIPDDVYMRLLLGSAAFSWAGFSEDIAV